MFKWLARVMDKKDSRAVSRLCGLTGWIGALILQFVAFALQMPLPPSYEMFMITCAALTGLEIVEGFVRAFKENENKPRPSSGEITEDALLHEDLFPEEKPMLPGETSFVSSNSAVFGRK